MKYGAVKCDHCDTESQEMKSGGWMAITFYDPGTGKHQPRLFDLCVACSVAFTAWMEGKGKGKA